MHIRIETMKDLMQRKRERTKIILTKQHNLNARSLLLVVEFVGESDLKDSHYAIMTLDPFCLVNSMRTLLFECLSKKCVFSI